jgi:hypothetical protein
MVSIDSVDQWYQERWSRFTASENYKLLIPGKKGEVFGDAAMTYIKQKAFEMVSVMWERPELEEVNPSYMAAYMSNQPLNATYAPPGTMICSI